MARPTDELRSYMATQGFELREIDELLKLGRLAMAMEIITVAKILEAHQLLAENEQMIAVLQTLLRDQDLMDPALEYYEGLSEWRRIKIDAACEAPDAPASEHEALADEVLPHGSNVVRLYTGRKSDPPSAE